jgi:putative flippase GtrA
MLPSKEKQVRFFKSALVGGAAFVVQWVVLWVLKRSIAATVAHDWAYWCSVVTHYTLNRFWALPSSRQDSGKQFLEYLGTVLVGWVIQRIGFWFFIHVVGLSIMWSNTLAIPPSTIAVLALLNLRVFKK